MCYYLFTARDMSAQQIQLPVHDTFSHIQQEIGIIPFCYFYAELQCTWIVKTNGRPCYERKQKIGYSS